MAGKVKKETETKQDEAKLPDGAATGNTGAENAGSNTADAGTAPDEGGTGGDSGDGSDDGSDEDSEAGTAINGTLTVNQGETFLGNGPITPGTITAAAIGTMVPAGETVERSAVVFLGPHHRYSRGDTACFDAEQSQQLVARGIAVWPKDAKRELSTRPGADDHDTDIG